MSKTDPIADVARDYLASGWTSKSLREEDDGDPKVVKIVADRMAAIEAES